MPGCLMCGSRMSQAVKEPWEVVDTCAWAIHAISWTHLHAQTMPLVHHLRSILHGVPSMHGQLAHEGSSNVAT